MDWRSEAVVLDPRCLAGATRAARKCVPAAAADGGPPPRQLLIQKVRLGRSRLAPLGRLPGCWTDFAKSPPPIHGKPRGQGLIPGGRRTDVNPCMRSATLQGSSARWASRCAALLQASSGLAALEAMATPRYTRLAARFRARRPGKSASVGRWLALDAPGPTRTSTVRGSIGSWHSEQTRTGSNNFPQVRCRCNMGRPFLPAMCTSPQ